MGKQNPNHKHGAAGEPTVDQGSIQEEIRQLAYQLFCECGCEQGHDMEHWLEAERRVLGQLKNG